MSRPWPVLATTDAFGWMSSNNSLVTTTSTPVAVLKALIIFTKAGIFGLHEAAPAHQVDLGAFLGLPGRGLRPALAQSVKASPESMLAAANAVPPFIRVRRVKSVIVSSLDFMFFVYWLMR